MYRIVCESYLNYKKDFLPNNINDYRYKIAQPLELLLDLSLYEKEKENKTMNFKKLESFIFLVKNNVSDYPNFKSFLWSLKARGICGGDYNAMGEEEFHELIKIVDMFLRLSYWE